MQCLLVDEALEVLPEIHKGLVIFVLSLTMPIEVSGEVVIGDFTDLGVNTQQLLHFCRPSVTLMYRAQTTESIIMRPSPDCSPAILVFPYKI